MRNILLTISYDGTDFCGWQRQDDKDGGEANRTVQGEVEKGNGTQQHNGNIVPGKVIRTRLTFFDGVVEITEDQDHPEEEGQFLMNQHFAEQGLQNAVDGKSHADIADDQLRNALPDADIGFPIILFHHFLDILRGSCFDIGRTGSVYLVFGHVLISSEQSMRIAEKQGAV